MAQVVGVVPYTERELFILRLIAEGLTNIQVVRDESGVAQGGPL
jgi:DNA-binding CsgD family transcriptional regulator